MTNILLAGDSWGIGVYQGKGDSYSPIGEGIQSLLEEQGHQVTNVSEPGISNLRIINNIPNNLVEFDHIVFLQTDIFREASYHGPKGTEKAWRWLRDDFVDELLESNTIEEYTSDHLKWLYDKLNRLDRKILCIGGWSDLHPCISEFKNLVPVIASASQMLIPTIKEQVYISDFEYFTQLNDSREFMSKFGPEFKEIAINSSHKFEESCRAWNGDVHPNIQGYQQIVDVLVKYLIIPVAD